MANIIEKKGIGDKKSVLATLHLLPSMFVEGPLRRIDRWTEVLGPMVQPILGSPGVNSSSSLGFGGISVVGRLFEIGGSAG